MTTVYISRHSTPFKEHRGVEKISENNLIWNKMSPLSVTGEKEALKVSKLDELSNIDEVWSSEYVRAMCTAKWIAHKNNIPVNIDERLGERIHGIIPNDIDYDEYHLKQILDKEYKLTNGENQIEVRNRMLECLNEILKCNKNKKVFICSHSTAMTFLFMNWCEVNYETKEMLFNGKTIFDMKWNAPELFKMIFDENNNLISINNIKM